MTWPWIVTSSLDPNKAESYSALDRAVKHRFGKTIWARDVLVGIARYEKGFTPLAASHVVNKQCYADKKT